MRLLKSIKIVQRKTPGGKNVTHFKKEKPGHALCSKCGVKLNRARLNPIKIKKSSKVQRRPERPFPNLCSKCMREVFKEMARE